MASKTVGTSVLFNSSNNPGMAGGGEPMAAIITNVDKATGRVNLVVFDAIGQSHAVQAVALVGHGETAPGGAYASMHGDTHKPAPIPKGATSGANDVNNTSRGHMSQAQIDEGKSAGLPTTGGVTPKISADNPGTLSELEREQIANGTASAETKAKDKAGKDRAVKDAKKASDTAAMNAKVAENQTAAAKKAATPAKKAAAKKAPAKKVAAKKKR